MKEVKVMWIDCEPGYIQGYVEHLNKSGYEVDVFFTDGDEGPLTDLERAVAYDLAIMDPNVEDPSLFIELIRYLASQPTPIILFSARPEKYLQEKLGIELSSYTSYFMKGDDPDIFFAQLRGLFEDK